MSLLTYPKFQSPDLNGLNLSGGKVYFYIAGTSTPKDTYSDAALTTTNTNPVILDARGEANIYLNGVYKIILKDADDAEIWTEDNSVGLETNKSSNDIVAPTVNDDSDSGYVVEWLWVDTVLKKAHICVDSTVGAAVWLPIETLGSLASLNTINNDYWSGTDLAVINGGTGQSSAQAAINALSQVSAATNEHILTKDTGTGNAIFKASTAASTATTTSEGIVELATDAEVSTGTDTSRVAPVSSLGSHQGVCKAWVNFNGTGTVAIRDSYNVSSITDNGTGDYTINLSITMPSTAYSPTGICSGNNAYVSFPSSASLTATALTVRCRIVAGDSNYDPETVCVQIFGD